MSESVINRELNLVGAFALAVADGQRSASEHAVKHAAAAPAALVALEKYPHESVAFFAPILGLTDSGTVRLYERLTTAGLVKRQPGGNARTLALSLTPTGRRAVQRMRDARRRSIADTLAPLSPAERRQLTSLLEKTLAALPDTRPDARHLCRLCDHAACDETGTCPVDLAVTAAGHPSYEDHRQSQTTAARPHQRRRGPGIPRRRGV
jgi:DNA-binding MarR family transcriptional regulator